MVKYSSISQMATDFINLRTNVQNTVGAKYDFSLYFGKMRAEVKIPESVSVVVLNSKAEVESYIATRASIVDANEYYLGIQFIVLMKWDFSSTISSAVANYKFLIENTTVIQCTHTTQILNNFYSKFNWNSEWNSFGAPHFIGKDLITSPITDTLVTAMEHFHLFRCMETDWVVVSNGLAIASPKMGVWISLGGVKKKANNRIALDLTGMNTAYNTAMIITGMWYVKGTKCEIVGEKQASHNIDKLIIFTHGVTSIHGAYEAQASIRYKFIMNMIFPLRVLDLAGAPTIQFTKGGSEGVVVISKPATEAAGEFYAQEEYYILVDGNSGATIKTYLKGSIVVGVRKVTVTGPRRLNMTNHGDAHIKETGDFRQMVVSYDPIPIECVEW